MFLPASPMGAREAVWLPSPLAGEGLGERGMHPQDFAKALRQQMTDAEQLLWRHLRGHRLKGHKFRRQQPLGPYVVDFVHFGARLIVEADGGQHNASAHDALRDAWLRQQGFTVLRFWNNDILRQTDSVLQAIWLALEVEPPLSPTPLPQGERGKLPVAFSLRSPFPLPLTGEEQTPLTCLLSSLPSPLAGEGPGERGLPHHPPR